MSIIKQKLLNAISAHPKLAAFGIGLALTMAIETAIGMLDVHIAVALRQPSHPGWRAIKNNQWHFKTLYYPSLVVSYAFEFKHMKWEPKNYPIDCLFCF